MHVNYTAFVLTPPLHCCRYHTVKNVISVQRNYVKS
jgi:hypothetical protein